MVAGATRGAGPGIAGELGAAGATVYATGRTTRAQRSEYDRPETIEETAALINEEGGTGVAVQVDHLDPAQVEALAADRDVMRWGGQSLSSGELAQAYGFTDVDGSQPDAWRYIREVQDPGKHANTTGYR